MRNSVTTIHAQLRTYGMEVMVADCANSRRKIEPLVQDELVNFKTFLSNIIITIIGHVDSDYEW